MADMGGILAWTFVSECEIPQDVFEVLVPGEQAVAAYKKPLGTAPSSPQSA